MEFPARRQPPLLLSSVRSEGVPPYHFFGVWMRFKLNELGIEAQRESVDDLF
jgi:hypothetical protein